MPKNSMFNEDGTPNWDKITSELFEHDRQLRGFQNMLIITGTTAERPTENLYAGFKYHDTTLDKYIQRNTANTDWIDSNGNIV